MAIYKVVALALVLVLGVMVVAPSASAQGLIGQALKLFGIAYVVRQFGGEINNFINNLAGQRGVRWEGTTKVVPIISVGSGLYVGAAQVQGPPDLVDGVRAVGQVETSINNLRGRLLIPVNTTNPTRDLTRIKGVGVSALVDFRI
ncbi:MAG: hypothetical protein ACYC2Y_08765 [Armatimonadota bacterium]